MTTQTKTIRDRNLTAFLLAGGFTPEFIPRSDGGLDAEFPASAALDAACMAYTLNQVIPVQSFVAACRYISDAIHNHRQRQG